MKLIFCPKCADLFRLVHKYRACECGKSAGHYVDDLDAITYGEAIPVGFANYSFIEAIKNQPNKGMGKEFTAFVIPKHCPSINHQKKILRKK